MVVESQPVHRRDGLVLQTLDNYDYGGLGYACISDESMVSLGLASVPEHRKIICIYGKNGRALARCARINWYHEDIDGEEIIAKLAGTRLVITDPVVRTNAGAMNGDEVLVKRARDLKVANVIDVEPMQEELRDITPKQLSQHFEYMPMLTGDLILYDSAVMGTIAGSMFRVINTFPDGNVVVRPDTGTVFRIKR